MATAPRTGTDTVTVASKLPNGLTLTICEKHSSMEPVVGGGMREVTVYKPSDKSFTLNGTGVMWGATRAYPMSHGAALTIGVPKDLWEKWCEQNKGSALLVNGLVFAASRNNDVAAMAKERIKQKTGLEPLDPTKPMKVGRGAKAMQIETAEESNKPDEAVLEDQIGAG